MGHNKGGSGRYLAMRVVKPRALVALAAVCALTACGASSKNSSADRFACRALGNVNTLFFRGEGPPDDATLRPALEKVVVAAGNATDSELRGEASALRQQLAIATAPHEVLGVYGAPVGPIAVMDHDCRNKFGDGY